MVKIFAGNSARGSAGISGSKNTSVVVTILTVLLSAVLLLRFQERGDETASYSFFEAGSSSRLGGRCAPPQGIRPIKKREELGTILQEHNFTTGLEVGVKQGEYTDIILSQWKSCTSYKLVDLWKQQENYKDVANVDNDLQERFFEQTKARLEKYQNVTKFYRMYSTEAAKLLEKESLDFVYLDARHDYCGVEEDMESYWPLLRAGGIMAGHDFNSNDEVRGQDWALCMDGRKIQSAVKGAVTDFMLARGLTISVTYQERNFFTWMVQKPMC